MNTVMLITKVTSMLMGIGLMGFATMTVLIFRELKQKADTEARVITFNTFYLKLQNN